MVDAVKHEAERLRIGIRGGWVEPRAAIAWADEVIARQQEPQPALIDISLAGQLHREELVALLGAVPGKADSVAVMRQILADLLTRLEAEPELAAGIARYLSAAADNGDLPPDRFGHEAWGLDDGFALARQGIGTIEEARVRLLAYLRHHSVFEV